MAEFINKPDDEDRDKTNDIGKEGADPYKSDADWIQNGQQSADAEEDAEAVQK